MSNNSQKTKKQHYVPQSYLKAWAASEKHYVYVYDKKLRKRRINSIRDVASENYFYDVNPNDIFSEEVLEAMRKEGLSWDSDERSQGIEHTFANEVEGKFAELLKELINKTNSATPWRVNNCYFISEEKKGKFAAFLAIQYIRTKQVRSNIINAAECLSQALKDMGASDEMIKEYAVSKEEGKNIHAQMMMVLESLSEIALSFLNLTWILCINKTKRCYI